MLGVLGVAVALGLGIPAFQVIRDPGYHAHAWINPNGRPKTATGGAIQHSMISTTILQVELRPSPFWPRYRRCLLGRSWRDQPPCDLDPNRIAETCQHAHPSLVNGTVDGPFTVRWPPEILAEGRRLHPGLFPADSTQPAWQAGP